MIPSGYSNRDKDQALRLVILEPLEKCAIKSVSNPKMETQESTWASFREGEWVSSIDLQDAYLHVPIHPQYRKFL